MNIKDLDSYEVVETPEPKTEANKPLNLSDLADYKVDEPISDEDIKSNALNELKQVTTPILTSGALEAGRKGLASDYISNLAENLAFRGAGGMSSPIGTDLIKEQAISTGIGNALPSSVIEPTVTPNKIGRSILDESLLGTLGLGTKSGNLSRATKASIEASNPTNDLLRSLTSPIVKEDIYDRTSQILDVPNLDLAVPENKMIIKALEKRKADLQGFQLPIEAEETKRQLQGSVNYQSDKSAAKSAVSKAQARATREQTEKAAELVGKLEDFKKLKSKSGNIQVAKDIIESQIKPSTGSALGSGINALLDLGRKKVPAIGAEVLDITNKAARSGVGRALPFIAGGALGLAANAAEEGLESEPSGATQDMPDYWLEKGIRNPEEQIQRARLSSFKQGLPNQGRMDEVPSAYDKPETKQYKENVLKAKERNQLAPNYVQPIQSEDKLNKLIELHNQFRSRTGKGAEATAQTLDKAINGNDDEKVKANFLIDQTPMLRNKLK
jgi:hypothetical protein